MMTNSCGGRMQKNAGNADPSLVLNAQAHPRGPTPGPPETPVARLRTARDDKKE